MSQFWEWDGWRVYVDAARHWKDETGFNWLYNYGGLIDSQAYFTRIGDSPRAQHTARRMSGWPMIFQQSGNVALELPARITKMWNGYWSTLNQDSNPCD